MDVMGCFAGTPPIPLLFAPYSNNLSRGSDVALHRKQRWHFVWRKKRQRKFFLFVRSMIEAIASGWRAGAFVLVLTLSAFREIVGEQRQKK
jgi:hypothetical protein